MPSPISFEARSAGIGRARVGRLDTRHGSVDTPQFMPVGTQASVKAVTPRDLRQAGTTILLGNTYHLSLRPGEGRIARLGGLHTFMAWDGPILTDSGGYQVFSLGHLRTVDDDGVTFASHLDGSVVRLTPERAIAIQEALGSDIAMVLDHLVGADASLDDATAAMERTHAWAARSLESRQRPDQAVFGIIQGGVDRSLRQASTRAIAELPFDGIAIGGLSVGESKVDMASALDTVAETLADDPRPRYLMGVGSPEDFFVAIEHGVDLFDCVLPTRLARHGQLWTSEGRLRLANSAVQDDPRPVDPACRCETCRDYSRAYLAHLFRAGELLVHRLTSVHNLTYTLDLMRAIRQALTDGGYEALRDRVTGQFAAPDDDPQSSSNEPIQDAVRD
ncbi:MAG TPA: tRNA guanosine(34) transglycosylase Tgt [Candidatus Limnocylindria bacterium]|nr:tRNA guanosine(34) transglycosylase Tgt [Candidatus Limnocylindria bacterium]